MPEKKNESEKKSKKMAILLTCIHFWESKAGASLSPLATSGAVFNMCTFSLC
jgi:hypothetical protein